MVKEWREEHSRARVQQVQRTCGGGRAWCIGVEQGGQCGWSGMSEGVRRISRIEWKSLVLFWLRKGLRRF